MPHDQDRAGYTSAGPNPHIAPSAFPEEALYKAGFIEPPSSPGQIGKLGRYELLKELGHGGMGIVYLAQDTETKAQVALKTLHPDWAGSQEAAERFRKEAKVTRDLQEPDHDHIVQILHISSRLEPPYFVMPYYSAGSLAHQLHGRCAIPPALTQRLGLQIAFALTEAHRADVRHGDIKPSNILLDGGNARLADFGLARDFSSNVDLGDVRDRIRKGTAPYMSPLMARGEGEGLSSDIYMFGATMYEMLTGQPPYDGKSDSEIFGKIQTQPPKPILELNPDAPLALVRIIERAMERDQDKRYPSMKAVKRDLLDLEDGLPWYRVLPRFRVLGRRRGAIAALVLVAVGLLAASGVWFARNGPRAGVTRGLEVIRSFQVPGVRAWAGALPGDWDGDGTTDLYLMKNNTLTVVSAEGEVLKEHPLSVPSDVGVSLPFVGDVNGDGRDEAFLNWSLDGEMFIDVIGPSRFSMMRFQAKGKAIRDPSGVQHTSALIPYGLYDLDGNGQRRLLAKLNAGFQLEPRGICCFDLANQKMLWRYLTAPGPEAIAVGDFTADGKVEIALGSYAVANGAALENGTNDAHAYLYLLDHRGSLIWSKEFGDRYTGVTPFVADLDGDGRPALVAMVSAGPEYRPTENGHLYRLDKLGHITASYDAGAMLLGLRIAPLVPGHGTQLVAVDRLGRIHLLDKDFSLQRRLDLPHDPKRDMVVQVQAVEDFDGDGRAEIVLTTLEREQRILDVSGEGPVTFTHNHEILVLNADLSVRARYELYKTRKSFSGVRVVTADVDHDGRKEMIVLAEAAIILRLGR